MRWGLLSCTCLVLLTVTPLAHADDTAICDQGADPDRMLLACSHIIAAGRGGRDAVAEAYTHRGFAYGSNGDYDREIADDNKAIELNPRLDEAYANRGFAYGKKGDYDREIADETKAIELDPQLPQTYNNRGFAYGQKGDYDSAIADETKAIQISPELAQPYNNRGFAYGQKGDFDHAMADETRAIELKSDLWPAYYERGRAFAAKGDTAKALADFRIAAQQIPASDERRGKAEARVAELEKQLAPPAVATPAAPPIAVAAAPAVASEPVIVEPTAAASGKRVGLVIGNASYGQKTASGFIVPSLANPLNDARGIRDTLTKLGFRVVYGENLTKKELEHAIGMFAGLADEADVAIAYFSGHGSTFSDVPYLVPTDAEFDSLSAIPYELVKVEDFIGELRRARGVRIALIDACRDNDADLALKGTTGTKGVGQTRGLARVSNADGLIIVYATQFLTTAQDGDSANSPFAAALVQHLPTPGEDVKNVLFDVANDVVTRTKGKQRPEVSVSMFDSFMLK
jgi:tetratricopeptide (TPR) repeat protein